MNKNSNSAKNSAQEFLSRFHGNAKGFKLPKFEMPGKQELVLGQVWRQACSIDLDNVAVHVDVDFMGPFVTSVKKASRDVWLQLPPPVRQAAPYVGAGLGTGVLVFSIQQRRLDHAVSLCSHDALIITSPMSMSRFIDRPAGCRMLKTMRWSSDLRF